MSKQDPLDLTLLAGLFKIYEDNPERIKNREGVTLEFKESYNRRNMSQYFKTMASFANNKGGYIIFGVSDRPRKLVGLSKKSLSQFDDIKVENLTNSLLEYFSPAINWDLTTFEFQQKSFGVIYVYPLSRKPCICKKQSVDENNNLLLKDGDIYYRYAGRSQKIRYTELNQIIEESRKEEERLWLNLVKNAAHIGITNVGILDTNSGFISGNGGTVLLDQNILHKIAFIKEGQFVETGGKPTLRVVGDVEKIDLAKVVFNNSKVSHREVDRAIEETDVLRHFLLDEAVEQPEEYLKLMCSLSSKYLPIYFYLNLLELNREDSIQLLNNFQGRKPNKKKLLNRLKGEIISVVKISENGKKASKEKKRYVDYWINNENVVIDNKTYCLQALLSIEDEVIKQNHKSILSKLMSDFYQDYSMLTTKELSWFRTVLARIDEVLYAHCING